MAKIIDEGWAKPDDPIYKQGPLVGGIRWSKPETRAPKQAPDEKSEEDLLDIPPFLRRS